MPQPDTLDLFTGPPIATRLCPACKQPMSLSLIEPTYQYGYGVHTFECLPCNYVELALIKSD